MDTTQIVLVALGSTGALGFFAYAALIARGRRNAKKFDSIEVGALTSKWFETVSHTSTESEPAMNIHSPKPEPGGLRPLNLSVPGDNPELPMKIPIDTPLL